MQAQLEWPGNGDGKAVSRTAMPSGGAGELDDPRVERVVRNVDLGAMAKEAVQISAAIDALLALNPPAGIPADAAAECDVLDALPYVCVSGPAANQHTSDAWVTVDLGGADVYTNHTGVGACVGDVEDQEPEPCVGISVDLGGNDRYEPMTGHLHACEMGGFGPEKGVCTQGVGMLGIGMLVDAAGDETYEAAAVIKDGDCLGGNFSICGVVDAQASGRFGIGVLADLGGDDRYSTAVPIPGRTAAADWSVTLSAQGSTSVGGGVLWDDGGNDIYTVSGPATGFLVPDSPTPSGWSTYAAQGVAVSGIGIVLEDGGTDSFLIEARPGPGAEDRRGKSQYGEGAAAGVGLGNGGQGIGFSGFAIPTIGAIIEGRGNTLYVIDMRARFGAAAQGQGHGPEGYLVDDGGDDLYRIEAHTDAAFEDRCATCAAASIRLDRNFQRPAVNGQGEFAGTLLDREGNDRYVVRSEGLLSASAVHPASATAEIATGSVYASAQGAGGGDLTDLGGDDVYLVEALSEQRAEAIGEGDRVASLRQGGVSVAAQGIGGTLSDRGGADTYDVVVDAELRAIPETPGSVDEGYVTVQGHGLGYPFFWEPTGPSGGLNDVDAGEADRFSIDSPLIFELCSGRYGESPGWAAGVRRAPKATGEESCSGGRPKAFVTSTSAGGADVVLDIQSLMPVSTGDGGDALEVVARLTRTGGSPVSEAEISLAPEGLFGEPYYGIGPFVRWTQVEGGRTLITDADGFARGSVTHPPCAAGSCEGLRLAARFFGEWGALRPGIDRHPIPPA